MRYFIWVRQRPKQANLHRDPEITDGRELLTGLCDYACGRYDARMRFIVTGADATTGQERKVEIDAADADEAENRARYSGLMVESVTVPTSPAIELDYSSPSARPKRRVNYRVSRSMFDRLTVPTADVAAAPRGPAFRCPNPNCDYSGASVETERGSVGLGILLLLIGILPGVLYFILAVRAEHRCPRCGLKIAL